MGIDRRMFERTSVAVDGELRWQIRGRSGLVTTKRVKFTTHDLSIDGARIATAKTTRLPVGASVLLTLGDEVSAARVRGHLQDPDKKRRKLVLLQFDAPSAEFLRVVDHCIEEGKGGQNHFKAAYWDHMETSEELYRAEAV